MRLYYRDSTKGKVCVHSTSIVNDEKEYLMKPYSLKREGVVIESGLFCPKDFNKIIISKNDLLKKPIDKINSRF